MCVGMETKLNTAFIAAGMNSMAFICIFAFIIIVVVIASISDGVVYLNAVSIARHSFHVLPFPSPTSIYDATESAAKLMRQLNAMDFVSVWSNVVRLTGSAAEMCESANGIMGAQQGHIGQIIDNFDEAVSSLRSFAATISENPSLLLRPRDGERLPETK